MNEIHEKGIFVRRNVKNTSAKKLTWMSYKQQCKIEEREKWRYPDNIDRIFNGRCPTNLTAELFRQNNVNIYGNAKIDLEGQCVCLFDKKRIVLLEIQQYLFQYMTSH